MSEEKKIKEAPRISTHLHVNRKLSRADDEPFDADEYANEYYNFQDRRSSSQSISRFNSCPQLAEQNQTLSGESYEQTTDDIKTGSNKITYDDERRVFVQGPSPVFDRRSVFENGRNSDTPTPPSTPKSRRSPFSSRDSLLSSPDKAIITSPFASPRLLLRKQLIQSALSRDSSIDSLTDRSNGDNKKVPLSVENLSKFEDMKPQLDDAIKSPKDDAHQLQKRRGSRRGIQPEDNVNKCENWLQTLHIAQTDRIKSRSNIQLPPI